MEQVVHQKAVSSSIYMEQVVHQKTVPVSFVVPCINIPVGVMIPAFQIILLVLVVYTFVGRCKSI